jgi:glycosyltransferase involved in cell wall biosynthesis
MRIGIDGGCLANRRGFGRFARQALRALAGAGGGYEFAVFVDRPSLGDVAGAVPGGFETVPVEVAEAPSRAASSTGRRRLGDMLAMGRAAARAGLDLMYFPASYSFFPVWNVGRVVVTMHDTLALARPELVFPTWQGRVAWALKEHLAARRADLILTVSEAARRDLLAWFRLPEDRIRVVPEAPESVFGPRPLGPASEAALRRYGLDPSRRFFLYVGGLSPHKNLPRLIEAFARSGLAAEGYAMGLVGDTGDVFHTHVPELRAAVDRAGLGAAVVFTGFVPDDDLAYLYSRAEALVQPSLMEGFGLPPVEAMACGTPVLSSTAGSLPEVVRSAGLFFDPTDVAAMAGALRRVADAPWLRGDLAARALAGARRFTREATAGALLRAFEDLGPPRPRVAGSVPPARGRRRSA